MTIIRILNTYHNVLALLIITTLCSPTASPAPHIWVVQWMTDFFHMSSIGKVPTRSPECYSFYFNILLIFYHLWGVFITSLYYCIVFTLLTGLRFPKFYFLNKLFGFEFGGISINVNLHILWTGLVGHLPCRAVICFVQLFNPECHNMESVNSLVQGRKLNICCLILDILANPPNMWTIPYNFFNIKLTSHN